MHPALVAPWASCEVERAALLASIRGLPSGDWSARPRAESWSVAEHVDHLIRSEVGTSKMVRRLIRGDFADLVRPPEARLYGSHLDRYPYDRLPAPAGLVPAAVPLDQAIEQLDAAHSRFEDELRRFDGPDADALAAPDPATDVWFTLAGWVRLQALHEEHHFLQVRALLDGRTRPGAS